ncbi:MAG TPA: hypothetical protein VFI39_06000 [Gemmatimonadales bacterium]|nr:hypothetical protein [Gemmatimonadales bacterium]
MRAHTRQYLVGVVAVTVAALAAAQVLPSDAKNGAWLGLGLALVFQAPLGWWLVRSIGTERFLAAWIVGMLVRVALLTLAGLVILPALHWTVAPGLVGLALVLLALLAVEVLVAMTARRSTTEAR